MEQNLRATDGGIGSTMTVYSLDISNRICERLAKGDSLLSLTREEWCPGYATVYRWLEENRDGFRDRYAQAREVQGHVRAEMAIEAADTADDAALGRLKYDALKWHASKLVPKVYGDRTVLAGDPDAPLIPPDTRPDPASFLAEWAKREGKE